MTNDNALRPDAVPLVAYETVRPLIRSGDLLLCQGSSIFSRLIQHATGAPWSHCACLLRLDALDRIMVVESVESIGCRAVPLSHYVHRYGDGGGYPGRVFIGRHAVFSTDNAPAFTLFSQRAIDLLGSAYDTQTILRIAARVVAAQVGFHPAPISRDDMLICSEYVYEIYKAFGITMPYGTGGYIAPKDWAESPDIQVRWEVAIVRAP